MKYLILGLVLLAACARDGADVSSAGLNELDSMDAEVVLPPGEPEAADWTPPVGPCTPRLVALDSSTTCLEDKATGVLCCSDGTRVWCDPTPPAPECSSVEPLGI